LRAASVWRGGDKAAAGIRQSCAGALDIQAISATGLALSHAYLQRQNGVARAGVIAGLRISASTARWHLALGGAASAASPAAGCLGNIRHQTA